MIAYSMTISPVMVSDSLPSAQYINIEGSRYEVSAGKVTVNGVEYPGLAEGDGQSGFCFCHADAGRVKNSDRGGNTGNKQLEEHSFGCL
jgi:hypothetical protein